MAARSTYREYASRAAGGRVLVLRLGDLVVRGYTEAFYAEALTAPARDS